MIPVVPVRPETILRVPENPATLGLPVATWWPGQREAVGRVIEAFEQARVVFLNAPPGSGKTIIAAAAAILLDTKSITMTHTIALQDQYRRTAGWAVIGKGKNNYPCGHPERPRAQGVIQTLRHAGRGSHPLNTEECDEYLECRDSGPEGCAYFAALGAAADADHVIFNYAFAARITAPATLRRGVYGEARTNPFRGDVRPLAILDEGHLANDAIVSAFTLDVWHRTVHAAAAGLEARPMPESDDPAAWQGWARAVLGRGLAAGTSDDPVLQRRIRNLKDTLQRISQLDPADWIVRRERNVTRVQPVWARCIYNRTPFLSTYPMVLIMSATLGDPSLLAHKLGFVDGECCFVDVPSVFPVQNRPVFYWPVAKLSSKSDEGDYAALASAIQYIATQPRLVPLKGIIHTPSYKLVAKLREHRAAGDGLDGRMLYQERPEDRERLVEVFTTVDHPWIIVTPSLATGFDYPYMVGFQIIAKTPFADLSDPMVRARRDYELPGNARFGKQCYDDDSLNQVVQACGRAVRAPDDTGVSYILDSNFWGLYKRAFSPLYFKDAMRWLE